MTIEHQVDNRQVINIIIQFQHLMNRVDYGLVTSSDLGRVRSQTTSVHVVYRIQRFDSDCNMVVTRKVIIRTPPPLRSKPL